MVVVRSASAVADAADVAERRPPSAPAAPAVGDVAIDNDFVMELPAKAPTTTTSTALVTASPTDAFTGLACPFSALGMGGSEIDRYLSDAKDRLRRGDPWQFNNTNQLESIALAQRDPALMSEFNVIETRTKDAMKHQIVAYRNKIVRFATTLVECHEFANDGNRELAAACYEELQGLDKEITTLYQNNRVELSKLIRDFHVAVDTHMKSAIAADCRHEAGRSTATVLTCVAAVCGSLPVIGWLKPDMLATTSFTNRLYAPVKKTADGVIVYKTRGMVKLHAGWSLSLIGGALGAFALFNLFRWIAKHNGQVKARETVLAKVNALRLSFVQQNDSMWNGMNMWVEDVATSIQVLKGLQPERIRMRRTQLYDIAGKLFGMSMAVDEYIFWLNKQGYFPANFSIRNFLTPDRYDRIKSIADDVDVPPPSATPAAPSEGA